MVTHAYHAGGAPKGFVSKGMFVAYRWWVNEVAAHNSRHRPEANSRLLMHSPRSSQKRMAVVLVIPRPKMNWSSMKITPGLSTSCKQSTMTSTSRKH